MRLAFAVQVLCDPEILIVDEALSVGDFFFQQKCFARLRKMREDGLTLLFVSHDMGTVRDLCSTALYLVRGEAAYWGDSKAAIQAFLAESMVTETPVGAPDPGKPEQRSSASADYAQAVEEGIWRCDISQLPDGTDPRLLAVILRDESRRAVTTVRMGQKLIVEVFFRSLPGDSGHISLSIKNRFDQVVSSIGTYLMGMEPCASGSASFAILEFQIGVMLEAGQYSLMVSYGKPIQENRGRAIDATSWFGPLAVQWDYEHERAPFHGMFGLPAQARLVVEGMSQ